MSVSRTASYINSPDRFHQPLGKPEPVRARGNPHQAIAMPALHNMLTMQGVQASLGSRVLNASRYPMDLLMLSGTPEGRAVGSRHSPVPKSGIGWLDDAVEAVVEAWQIVWQRLLRWQQGLSD